MAQIVTITNPLTGQPAQVDQLEHTAQEIDDGIGFESTDYPGCYYRMVDGVVEWFNPPMESRTEYRTTERYYGEPVYIQELSFSGALPNNGGSQTIFPLPVASTNIIDIQCTIVNDTTHEVQSLPAISDSGACIAFLKVLKIENYDNWCFRITTFADLSQWVCKKMVVKYTKTGG